MSFPRVLLSLLALIGLAGVPIALRSPGGASSPAIGPDVRAAPHRTAGHTCDGSCGPGPEARSERRAIADTRELTQVFQASAGELLTVSLVPGETRGVRVLKRTVREDGRVTVAAATGDGERLFLVSDGERWEGRLEDRSGLEAWILSGDRNGGTMVKRRIDTLRCATIRGEQVLAGLPPLSVVGPAEDDAPSSPLELAEAQPLFNSLPGAAGVIYLDFDGETVSGTQWNASFTNGADIVAPGAGFSNAQIQLVWETIAEDYRPFNVNVTTDRNVYNSYSANRKTMMIFTPNNEWYGAAGGVAYVDIFGSSFYDEPGWVFTDQLLYNNTPHAPWAAEAGSHEAGHVMGLSHDGTATAEYYEGHGSGATSWCPIMGAAYQASVSHWSRGEYTGASNTEDDLAIIAGSRNGLGYRIDDHSGSTGSATPLTRTAGDRVSAQGLIERTADVDMFSVETGGGAIAITATNDPTDPNLDLRLRLLNAQGAEVAVANPLTGLDATLTASVPAGTYYVEVDGAGTGSPATGWSDYGSLGSYTLDGSVPDVTGIFAQIISPADAGVSLPEGVGLVIEGAAAGGTVSWDVLQAPSGGRVTFSSPGTASTRCGFSAAGLYALRLLVDSGSESAEDTLMVSVEADGSAKVYANRGPSINPGPDRNVYDVAATLDPAAADDGIPGPLALEWTILSGNGSLSDPRIAQPVLTFGAPEAVELRVVTSDGAITVFAEVELTGRFLQETLVATDAPVTALVPRNGLMDNLWRAPGFDDSDWRRGFQGVGYDANKGPSSRRIYLPLMGTDVEAEMYDQAAGCYVRAPFQVSQGDRVLSLTLRVKYDDGFVAYINGTEVARGNAPAAAPAWNTLALTNRPDEAALSFQTYQVSLPPGSLVDGTNILALHGMNSAIAKNEREFVLLAELEATLKDSPFLQTVSVVGDPFLQGATDDPDGDGWNNLIEHAGGTDPLRNDSFPGISVTPGSDLSLRLPASPPDDVRYEIQESMDLDDSSWRVLATRTGAGPWTGQVPLAETPAGPGFVDWLFAAGSHPQAFYRLRLTLVTP